MPGVTREQIDRAKQVDILDYVLKHEPDNVKRIGNAYYLKDHDSFSISNGLWIWRSRDIGGKNVVDYLVKVRGYSFVDAVRHLAGDAVSYTYVAPKTKPPLKKERPPFALPPRNKDNERVIAYLQERGIAKPLILDCIERGSVYESAKWHNAVFVGRDDNGKAHYATMRGTTSDFKRDADGSDKRFGFVLSPTIGKDSDTVAVFESPVDALSHQILCPDYGGWRLSLGCTALAALANFFERHDDVKNCIACTDNDDAGNNAAKKIADLEGIRSERQATITKAIQKIQSQIKSVGGRKTALYDKYCDDGLTRNEYISLRDAEDSAITELNKELLDLEDSQAAMLSNQHHELSERLDGVHWDGVLTREITEALLDCVLVHDDGRVEIKWTFGNPIVDFY